MIVPNGMKRLIYIVFFLVLLGVGVAVYRDFGMPIDNSISRNNGVFANRFLKGDRSIDAWIDRYYSTGLELPLVMLEEFLQPRTFQGVFQLRYIVLYILFTGSLITFAHMISQSTSRWWLGLVGVMGIVLYPRIFVDAFTNTKDVGLLLGSIMTVASLMWSIQKPTMLRVIIAGALFGWTISIRPVGLVFAPLSILMCYKIVKHTKEYKYIVIYSTLYIITVIGGILAFWPYLWPNPIERFITALTLFSKYPFPGSVLFMGDYIKAGQTPWYYSIVWIFVSVPLVVLFGGILGIGRSVFQILTHVRNKNQRVDILLYRMIALYWLVVPIIAIIVLKSVVYDGWRHLYFVYPALVLLMVYAIDDLWEKRWIRPVIIGVLILQTWTMVSWSVRTHPHQHVYFNFFSGGMKQAKQHFDLDYWALSYRQCLEAIVQKDRRAKINVYMHYAQEAAAYILPEADRQRIVVVDSPIKADYIISNYREHKEEYPAPNPPFYTVEIEGTRIAVVYQVLP